MVKRTKFILVTMSMTMISLLFGCQDIAMVGRPLISCGIIENNTQYPLREVKVFHLPIRSSVSVGTILPYRSLQMGFEATELRGETAIISWVENGQNYKVTLPVPQIAVTEDAQSTTLVYRLHSGGTVTAHLIIGQYP